MSDVPSNVVPFNASLPRAHQGAPVRAPNVLAMLRGLGATMATIPDCGTPMAEIASECMRFSLPAYCGLCERNPANASGAA